MMNFRKLFTLIELIVVIVILGILAAIVVPNISSFKDDATQSAVISNVRNIQVSSDSYALKNNGELPSIDKPIKGSAKPVDFNKIVPKELRSLPKTKGIKYWIDYKGTVWGSPLDSPTNVEFDGSKITWDLDENAIKYNVYSDSQNTTSAASTETLTLVGEIDPDTYNKDRGYLININQNYYVSAIDEQGFETPPSNGDYKGYDFYIQNTEFEGEPTNNTPSEEPAEEPKTGMEAVIPLESFSSLVYADAVNGDDINGDGSEEKPYKTLPKAISKVTSDGAIFLKGSFNHTKNTTYDFKDKPSVSIIGDYLKYGSAITGTWHFHNTNGMKIYGMYLYNTDTYTWGESFAFSNHIEVYNSVFHDSSNYSNVYYDDGFYFYNSLILRIGNIYDRSHFYNTAFVQTGLTGDYTVTDSIFGVQHNATFEITSPTDKNSTVGVYSGQYKWTK